MGEFLSQDRISYIRNMKIKTILFCLLFVWILFPVHGQENTVTSGGNISNPSGSVAFTVGQVFYTSVEGENGSINEGVQQTYTSEIITGLELNEITLQLFPNPTNEQAILKVEPEFVGLLNYSLYDESGRLIQSSSVISQENPIQLGGNSSGIYFLNVQNTTQTIKSFRIIKTH
jgi:hypothetical protein